jgi:hypothetical protein
VDAIDFSPDFVGDRTLEARARFYRIDSGESGDSRFHSTDGGDSWIQEVGD